MSDEITMRDLMDASLRAIDASIYALREQVISGQQASSRELVAVRAELRDLQAKFDAVPSVAELTTFQEQVYTRLGALERDLYERHGGLKARASIWAIVVGGSSVMGMIAGLVITLVRSFVPAA